MNICVLVLRVDSLTYTVVKALSFGGYNVFLNVSTNEGNCQLGSRLLKILASTPRVTVGELENTVLPETVDQLIVQGHPHALASRPMLETLAERAMRITMISAGDRRNPYRQAISLQWRELLWCGRFLRKIKRVAFKDGFYPMDIFGLIAPRRVVGFDVHSRFLNDPTAFQQIHSPNWAIEENRPILANFLGSQDPLRRIQILDAVRDLFLTSNGEVAEVSSGKVMFWHEYSDASPNALALTEYVDVLSKSDFTLCPPGYYLVTHRPIEALVRGSIPVLNSGELDLYDIDLVDGVNCIAVSPGEWPQAISRMCRLQNDQVVQMRRNVRAMFDLYLDYESCAKRIRVRLGLEA